MALNLVCVAFPAWEGNYVKSTVELMKRMAQRQKILYVDYQYTYKDVLFTLIGRANAPVKRMLGLAPRLRTMPLPTEGTIFVLTPPPVLPVNFLTNANWYDRVQRLNGWIIQRSIRRAMKKLDFSEPVVVNAFNPFLGNYLLGKLNEQRTVYYCYDEISECAWASNHGLRVERQFLGKVDGVVTTSIGLEQSKLPWTKQCFLVQNGVDYPAFAAGYVDSSVKATMKPVIGYIGTIDSRLDYSLLRELASRFEKAQLVLVGRIVADKPSVEPDLAQLRSLPNVVLVDAQPPSALPDLLKSFHIGIIPFVKNAQTAAIYPMKINEYLAAGLPVVSTDFAPLDEFASVIATATSTPAFVQAVQRAFETDSTENQHLRQQQAQKKLLG
ncbi:glycosyltransferase [Spirosoma foliorum]|uniref:Glycosyltransferase n=1 Tax=Spirosoma foliorum TaxID=2710596 RepID=A0A7G5H3Z6_9BACT|nr:glycosyltransferase [Spirosoma foliorum]QMW05838.1 glycosyltransferase [Spirosoma foliorum]